MRPRPSKDDLTAKQLAIVTLLSQGLNYTQISERLFISVETVRTHAAAIRVRLGSKNIANTVAIAVRRGLI
jgi:LuxR family maltose regulon positive regulatory protein